MKFVKYLKETGEITGVRSGNVVPLPEEGRGYVAVADDFEVSRLTQYVRDGEIVEREFPLEDTPRPMLYTFNEWLDRFSQEDQVAIVGASMGQPAVKLVYDRTLQAQYIDPTDPRTIAGTLLLAQLGVISLEAANAALGIS